MPTDDLGFVAEDDLGFVPEEKHDLSEDLGFQPETKAVAEPDMSPVRNFFIENLKKAGLATVGAMPGMAGIVAFGQAIGNSEPAKPEEKKQVTGFIDALDAGWQMSVSGLMKRKQLPNKELAVDAGMAAQVASGIGTIAGDLPAIIPAAIGGGVAGAPAGPGGVVVGAGAAGNAAPAMLRKILMDHYEKGDIKDANDFVSRAMSTMYETAKQGLVGGVTSAVGGTVTGKLLNPAAQVGVTRAVTGAAAEVGTMVTAGAALEGELPNAEDFTVAGLMVAAIHGVTKVATGGTKHVSGKLRQIYAETGIKPEQVVEDAKTNPIIQQELLIDNGKLPAAYKTEGGVETINSKPPVDAVSMADVLNEPVPEITKEHPAVREFLAQIKDQPEKAGAIENTVNKFKNAKQRYLDQADPLKKWQQEISGKQPVTFEDDFYKAKRMENEYKSKALVDFEDGHRDFKTGQKKQGEGLLKILKDAPDEDVLDAVLVAYRDTDYEGRGLKSGFNSETAAEIREMAGGKYESLVKRTVGWNHRSLKTILDAEVIDQAAYDSMIANGAFYIPLRHVDDAGAPKTSRGGKTIRRVKGMEDGAEAIIESPTIAMYENNVVFRRMAEQNRSALALLRFAEKNGVELVEVKGKAHQNFVDADQINKHLAESGIKGNVDGLRFWTQKRPELAPGEFEAIVQGKRKVFKVPEGAGPEFAEAMSAYKGDFQATGLAWGLLQGVTTAKKYSITSMPGFKLRGFWNDQFALALNTKGGAIPFVDAIMAIGHIIGKTDKYYDFMSSGAAQSQFLKIDDAYIRNKILEKHQKAGVFENAWNVLKEPTKIPSKAKGVLDTVGNTLETATRMAEQQAVTKKTGSLYEGGFAGREGTLDFGMRGSSQMMAQWNSVTAFLRPQILGVEKFFREFKEHPVKFTAKGITYITAPSVFLYWYNYGNPRVDNLSQFRKDMFWNIPLDYWDDVTEEDHIEMLPPKEAEYLTRIVDGKMQINRGPIISLPRAFLPGLIFGAAVDRSLDAYFKKDPRAFKDFDKAMRDQLLMPMIPDAPLPVLEGISNHNFFSGHSIIPQHLEKAAPELRYTQYTSESAKQLSKLIPYVTAGMSNPGPAITENYIRSWAGPVGQLALTIGDVAMEETGNADFDKPEQGWFENPIIGSFIARSASSGADDIKNLYDEAKVVDEKKSRLKDREKQGLEDGPQEALDRIEVGLKRGRLNQIKKAMSAQRKLIRAATENKEYSKHEKRQIIDGLLYMMINEARTGLAEMDEHNKELEEMKNAR